MSLTQHGWARSPSTERRSRARRASRSPWSTTCSRWVFSPSLEGDLTPSPEETFALLARTPHLCALVFLKGSAGLGVARHDAQGRE